MSPSGEDPSAVELARYWATENARTRLQRDLREFDGFAVPARDSERGAWPMGRSATWSYRRANRRGGRVKPATEMLVVFSPREPLYGALPHLATRDLVAPWSPERPHGWLEWALAHLGALAGVDEVVDFFSGERIPAFTDMLSMEEVA